MRRRRRQERPEVTANLTSLIDVTFLLIVFFVLVSRINEAEAVRMDLPSPKDAATVSADADHLVVINVLPAPDGTVSGYRVGATDFERGDAGLGAMTSHLAALYRANPRSNVNVRADRATQYEFVEPVMTAVSAAARRAAAAGAPSVNPRVNLVVTEGG